MKENKKSSKKLIRHREDPIWMTKSRQGGTSPSARNDINNNSSEPTENSQPRGNSCPLSTNVVWLKEGQECPNCHFAKLKFDENKDLKCPICGFGTAGKYT